MRRPYSAIVKLLLTPLLREPAVRGKRQMLATVLERSGLSWLVRRLGSWQGLLVLNYHRLAREPADLLDQGVWSATPEEFERQVAFLQRETELLAPGDVPACLDRPGRHTLLTFDDGYRDNYTLAFPVLRARGAAAVFFPVTSWIDQPALAGWDELAWLVRDSARSRELLRAWRQLSPAEAERELARLAQELGCGRAPASLAQELWLTWPQVREMAAAGMVFGGHTHTHVCLATLDAAAQEAEIATCLARLRTELGSAVTWFTYPYGARDGFNATTRRLLTEHGVTLACSQHGGWQRPGGADPLNLLRLAADKSLAPVVYRAVVSWPGLFARG